jgi:hypothetical protein
MAARQRRSRQVDPPLAEAASGGVRRPILIAALGLACIVVGAVAYFYAHDLIALASSLTGSRAIHTQGHIRY